MPTGWSSCSHAPEPFKVLLCWAGHPEAPMGKAQEAGAGQAKARAFQRNCSEASLAGAANLSLPPHSLRGLQPSKGHLGVFSSASVMPLPTQVLHLPTLLVILPQVRGKILILTICAAGIGGTFQYGYNLTIINAPTVVRWPFCYSAP